MTSPENSPLNPSEQPTGPVRRKVWASWDDVSKRLAEQEERELDRINAGAGEFGATTTSLVEGNQPLDGGKHSGDTFAANTYPDEPSR